MAEQVDRTTIEFVFDGLVEASPNICRTWSEPKDAKRLLFMCYYNKQDSMKIARCRAAQLATHTFPQNMKKEKVIGSATHHPLRAAKEGG